MMSLKAKYKSKWRSSSGETKYYCRRMVIINEIERLIKEEDLTESEAVECMEQWRGKATLNKLQQGVKAQVKDFGAVEPEPGSLAALISKFKSNKSSRT